MDLIVLGLYLLLLRFYWFLLYYLPKLLSITICLKSLYTP